MSSTDVEYTEGQRVRFTAGPLGALLGPDDSRFADHRVLTGTEGMYLRKHPQIESWHLVAVEHEGRTLYVPVHPGQFEAVR